jgi:competence protein ComEC
LTGILIGIKLELPAFSLFYLILLLIPIAFLNFYKAGSRSYKWLFMICTDVFLFMYGIDLVEQRNLSRRADFYGNQVNTDSLCDFIAVINDLPVEKEKFTKCDLKILEVSCNKIFQRSNGNVTGYFKHSPDKVNLKAGQVLLISAKFTEPSPPKNPYEFDYKNYLYNKQIYHTVFIDSSSYTTIPASSSIHPLWELGLRCKDFLLMRLKNSELSKNAYGICAALLTGYDDEIDKPVMEAFSHSGTLHVLSVSGLHTGLIYLLLNFLFDVFDRKKKYKLTRFIFITSLLWFFALITGFSAPVLRAVIMFNLMGFGKIYFRAQYRHQLNILLASAFILLAYNPFYILDVGFLLSYFALFGLIYFQPKISKKWQPENRIVHATWQSVSASVAATISTLPITLFYFKQFPLWFFVCNIVVVPATFLILILLLFVIFKVNVISVIINYMVKGLVWFIGLFNSEYFGFIDNIHFTFPDVFFLSLFIVLISLAFQSRSYKHLALGLILLIGWQLFSLVDSFNAKNKNLLTVYNIKNNTALSVKNKTRVHLNEIDSKFYNFNIKPHLNSFNYADLNYFNFNVVKNEKQVVLLLNTPGFWPDIDSESVTTLVLGNNFKLLKSDLEKFRNLQTLVTDASNNTSSVIYAEELCRNFDVNFYNTKNKGAYLLTLQ